MSALKQLRKSKYPIAKNFLDELLQHDIKYTIPEWSMIETDRAIPSPEAVKAICAVLGCSQCDILDLSGFGKTYTAAAPKPPRKIPNRDITFQELPEPNPKRSAGRWSNEDWERLQTALNGKSVKQYLKENLLK